MSFQLCNESIIVGVVVSVTIASTFKLELRQIGSILETVTVIAPKDRIVYTDKLENIEVGDKFKVTIQTDNIVKIELLCGIRK